MSWLQEAYEFTDVFPFLDFMDIPNGEDKYNEIKVKANRLLKFLFDADVVQPIIFKGEIIQLEWGSKSRYLEIEIREDGYHLLYRDTPNEIEVNCVENDFNIILRYVRCVTS